MFGKSYERSQQRKRIFKSITVRPCFSSRGFLRTFMINKDLEDICKHNELLYSIKPKSIFSVHNNLVLGNRDRWESRIRSLESMHKSWKSLFKLSKLDKQINRAILKNCIKFCNTVSVHHCLFWFSHQHWSQG